MKSSHFKYITSTVFEPEKVRILRVMVSFLFQEILPKKNGFHEFFGCLNRVRGSVPRFLSFPHDTPEPDDAGGTASSPPGDPEYRDHPPC